MVKYDSARSNSTYNAAPLIENVFRKFPDMASLITFKLNRPEAGASAGGIFTIGEIPEDLKAITASPKLDIVNVTRPLWSTTVDGVLINGSMYTGHSNV